MSALSIAMELPAHDVFNMGIVLEPARRLCLIAWRIGVFMGQVLQFSRRDKTFDAETTAVLISAYEKATAAIEKSGQPCIMHEVAARRIIAMASKGERNPDRLCAAALATVAKSARDGRGPRSGSPRPWSLSTRRTDVGRIGLPISLPIDRRPECRGAGRPAPRSH